MKRIFLLSPASTSGRRAELLLRPTAEFPLALKLRRAGAPLGEVFAFLSGLYFRGKLTYADRFALPPPGEHGAWIITAGSGLLPASTMITAAALAEFAATRISIANKVYLDPFRRDLERLESRLPARTEVVLLGSVGTPKYVQPLVACFGERVHYPSAFLGRGDMSRGALMLRAARRRRELSYRPLVRLPSSGKRASRG